MSKPKPPLPFSRLVLLTDAQLRLHELEEIIGRKLPKFRADMRAMWKKYAKDGK